MSLIEQELQFLDLEIVVKDKLAPEIQELKDKNLNLEVELIDIGKKVLSLESEIGYLKMFIRHKFPEDHI